MFVKHAAEIQAEPVTVADRTSRQVLIGSSLGPNFAMRRFVIGKGGSMPLHTNTVEHEQYVLGGTARVVIGEEMYTVRKDDVVFIPAGIKHSYTTIGDEDFEFICIVPNKPDETTVVR
jgi:quercetin dioxygenase-like cupin family protein